MELDVQGIAVRIWETLRVANCVRPPSGTFKLACLFGPSLIVLFNASKVLLLVLPKICLKTLLSFAFLRISFASLELMLFPTCNLVEICLQH